MQGVTEFAMSTTNAVSGRAGAGFVPVEVPAWATWGQRAGIIIDRREWPRGPNGRRLCGWCQTECEGRRTSWCSDRCSNLFGRVWSWGAVSQYVRDRDGHQCQRCGTTEPPPPKRGRGWSSRYSPWDVDHIIPVAAGGTDDPANLRLLCIPCHTAVGYEQHAARRVPAPAEQLSLIDAA